MTVDGETSLGNLTTTSFQKIANNVTEITLLTIGYLIPERPNFLTKQIEFSNKPFLYYKFCFSLENSSYAPVTEYSLASKCL